jgi:uncharacterized phiE125 gp8 family phage protein
MMLDGLRQREDILYEGMRTGPSNVTYTDHIELAGTPVISVENVKYYSDDNTETTWPSSNYYVDIFSEPARIILRDSGTFPTDLRAANGLEINFTAGYGSSPNTVPEAIRVAILQYMAYLYEHRGDYEAGSQPPSIIRTLLDPYRIMRLNSTPYDKVFRTGMM